MSLAQISRAKLRLHSADCLRQGAGLHPSGRSPLPTNYITGYYTAPSLTDPDYPAFRAAVDMLSDRLFEEVRTKRNMTYAVSAGLETRAANRGRLYVTATQPDTTVKVIFSTVRQLQNDPISAEAVAENVQPSITSYLMGQET